ncbi:amidase [Dongia deserti]|uniref:amidase n=1 Tax=Dongia deserti TaxID=2268030 RepID=UPI000E6576F4|nr:amidase family protein [Dongia deserti]
MPNDLYRLTAREAVRRLRSGEITPLDLIDAVERRAAQVNGVVNALVTPCYDRARDHARRLMALPPSERGLLAGLPVGIKDLNDVAGVRTTYGSPIFAENVPAESEPLVEAIEANGGIVVGKTNTPEFGAGANTFNAVFGETLNPWNPALNAAGSSGGSAAALATSIVALASGSDLGGSLRTPASFCSVVGFRPSPGRVASARGEQRFDDLSVEGPMARNVLDVALLLDAMSGWCIDDPISLPSPPEPFLTAAQRKQKPKRIALAMDLGGATPVDKPTRAIVRQAADTLANAGIEIVEASPDFSGAKEAFHVLRGLRYVANMSALMAQHRDKLKSDVIWNVEQGMTMTAERIAKALLYRARLYGEMVDFLKRFDFLLTPAACCAPNPIEERWVREVDGHKFENYLGWLTLPACITLTTCPAISIPAGFTEDGRPIGIQLVGRPRGDAALLSASAAIEEILGFADAVPIDPKPARELA